MPSTRPRLTLGDLMAAIGACAVGLAVCVAFGAMKGVGRWLGATAMGWPVGPQSPGPD